MRNAVLILLISAFQVFATGTYSQTAQLSLKLKDATIKEVLSEIENQSEFYFLYNSELIDVTRKVDISVKNEKVNDVLSRLFSDNEVNVSISDRHIVLTPVSEMSAQQQNAVSGKVTDSSNQPLPGVTVMVAGTTNGTVTNADGNYTIANMPEDAVLQFSFVGMKAHEIAVGSQSSINVVMEEDAIGIEEVVAVGYGTQKKGNLTGSIGTIKSDELVVSPVASTTNALAGRLPGLVSLQSSGQPGADFAALSIRGFGGALIIVDGVETDFNAIDANQIESISILKDGSASIYGARAGNGVILVTTKRGKDNKPTITFNTSQTRQSNTAMPKTASSGQYAEMERETWLQSGKPEATAPFTQEQIQKYYQGGDPQYPNTNWSDVLIDDWAPQQQHNLSVRGGSDKIKYYGFVGYLDQESMWKNNGGEYKRYNLQSNIDAKILDNLSFQLDLSSIVETKDYPASPQYASFSGAWSNFWTTLPIYPSSLPDPTKIPATALGGAGNAHVMTNSELIGYDRNNSQNLKGTMALNYQFLPIEGLSAKAFVNYNQNYQTNKNFQKPVAYYLYDYASDTYTNVGGSNEKAKLFLTKDQFTVTTGQLSLNYDQTFANAHHVNALALFEAIDYKSDNLQGRRSKFLTSAIDQLYAGDPGTMESYGSASEMGRKSYVARLNYSYKDKYLIESTFRADASAKFPADKRWGYFPSVSAGWVVTQENFMKNIESLSYLKIRASYGESGNDAVGNFQYLSGYALTSFPYGGTYMFGTSNSIQALASTGLANPTLTWEQYTIYNTGFDFAFWNRKLYGEGDVFYRTRTGIPAYQITSLPSTFGSALPPVNLNSLNNRGFEFKIGTEGNSGDFKYNLSGNISYSRSKWDHYEEPEYTDFDQARIYARSGKWTDISYGYISDGLFTSQQEIDNLGFNQDQQGNKSLRPGDIKFKDMNGDKILDWKDQQEIGEGNMPHWMCGLNTELKYKNFDLSVLFQGAFGYFNYVNVPSSSTMKYELRWTEEKNSPNALVPRLGGAGTNGYVSDYYYKEAGYIRLKTMSLGYSLPTSLLSRIKVGQVRVFLSGTNLITFDKLEKYGIDPEAPSGYSGYYYPQQKTISLGINISI